MNQPQCNPRRLWAVGVLALLLAACGSSAQPPGAQPPASQKGPSAPALGGASSGAQEPTGVPGAAPVASSHGGPVADQVSLIDALRKDRGNVMVAAAVQQPFLSVGGTGLTLNGAAVQVFEYPDAAAAQADLPKLTAAVDGSAPSKITWAATPHAYASGRILVVYVGDDPDILQRLQAQLGAPRAAAPSRPAAAGRGGRS